MEPKAIDEVAKWKAIEDELTGDIYYFCQNTGAVQWDKPKDFGTRTESETPTKNDFSEIAKARMSTGGRNSQAFDSYISAAMRKCEQCCTDEKDGRPLSEFEMAMNEEALLTFTRIVGISNAYHKTLERSKALARGMCDREYAWTTDISSVIEAKIGDIFRRMKFCMNPERSKGDEISAVMRNFPLISLWYDKTTGGDEDLHVSGNQGEADGVSLGRKAGTVSNSTAAKEPNKSLQILTTRATMRSCVLSSFPPRISSGRGSMMPSIPQLFKMESCLRALSSEQGGGARFLSVSVVGAALSRLHKKKFLPTAWRSVATREGAENALIHMTGLSNDRTGDCKLDYKKLITCVLFGIFPRIPTANDLVNLAQHFVSKDFSGSGVSSQRDFSSAEFWFDHELEGNLVFELKRFLWNMWNTGSGLCDYRGMVSPSK